MSLLPQKPLNRKKTYKYSHEKCRCYFTKENKSERMFKAFDNFTYRGKNNGIRDDRIHDGVELKEESKSKDSTKTDTEDRNQDSFNEKWDSNESIRGPYESHDFYFFFSHRYPHLDRIKDNHECDNRKNNEEPGTDILNKPGDLNQFFNIFILFRSQSYLFGNNDILVRWLLKELENLWVFIQTFGDDPDGRGQRIFQIISIQKTIDIRMSFGKFFQRLFTRNMFYLRNIGKTFNRIHESSDGEWICIFLYFNTDIHFFVDILYRLFRENINSEKRIKKKSDKRNYKDV